MNFTANFLFSDSDEVSVTAGLADDQFDTKQYILFERNLRPSEQDQRLGHDQPRFELNDQYLSAYGDIESVRLDQEYLDVTFKTPPKFGLKTLAVRIGNGNGIDALADGLKKIFGECFVDCRTSS